MVRDQIQGYVNLMTGLRRATKAKASEAAQGLLSATGLDDVAADAGERVSNLAEEILTASRANRELLLKMINVEIDKAAARTGSREPRTSTDSAPSSPSCGRRSPSSRLGRRPPRRWPPRQRWSPPKRPWSPPRRPRPPRKRPAPPKRLRSRRRRPWPPRYPSSARRPRERRARRAAAKEPPTAKGARQPARKTRRRRRLRPRRQRPRRRAEASDEEDAGHEGGTAAKRTPATKTGSEEDSGEDVARDGPKRPRRRRGDHEGSGQAGAVKKAPTTTAATE